MYQSSLPEKHKIIIIGAGQAGLSMGYFLKMKNLPFLILDAGKKVGDSWRTRWDTLHLFTPARYDSLAGFPFPSKPDYFPTKDEMGDYLESYAKHFNLPVRCEARVSGLTREGNTYKIQAGNEVFEAEHVIIAMSDHQAARIPAMTKELEPGILQIHSKEYKNPSQLKSGKVLVVGSGNTGCEIALEVSKSHPTWLSGRNTGHIPFNINGYLGRHLLVRFVLRFLFHRVLTIKTPMGRKARKDVRSKGGPLIRIKPDEIKKAGIPWVPKMKGVKNGMPLLENGEVLDVQNLIWCTGYYPGFSWTDLPVFNGKEPIQERGIVPDEPGLYFLGQLFLYSLSSSMVHGVGRDAAWLAEAIARRIQASGSYQSGSVERMSA